MAQSPRVRSKRRLLTGIDDSGSLNQQGAAADVDVAASSTEANAAAGVLNHSRTS
jgi:hypothetical protein